MGDDSSESLEGKSLSNLRVVDLKHQLEKRGLSKSGSKKELVKRLKQKLELEKLYEESATIGDTEPKLHLDEATEQNEFVQKYLAEQQKIYARQKEVKRLIELKEQEKADDEEETDSDFGNKDQDSDVSESISVAKNSCDSTADAEDGEEKESKSFYEENESHNLPAKYEEPESSTQGDPDVVQNTIEEQDHSHSDSSHNQINMDTSNPDSAVSYSLADIQLPDSPKKMYSKVVLKGRTSDNERSSSHESSESEDVSTKKDIEQNKETNGTSNIDEDSDHSRESVSPRRETDSSEAKEQDKENVEKMEICDNKTIENDNQEPQKPDADTTNSTADLESKDISSEQCVPEKSPERQNETVDENLTKDGDMEQKDDGKKDGKVSTSAEEDEKMEVSETRLKKPKRDVEEGETDVDTDSEEEQPKEKESDAVSDRRTGKKLVRQASEESMKSDRSVSREHSVKEPCSSSSDSSSSHESIPKRKSYRSTVHQKENHSSSSGRRRHSNAEDNASNDEKSRKLSPVQSAPRRVKIKRSTAIVAPVEPEPKKEVKRHHKKIEMESDSSESKSGSHSSTKTNTEEKVASKSEHLPKKRPAADPPTESVPTKVTYRKLNVPFRKTEESKEKATEKKSLWHSSALPKAALSISSDSLKSLIPDFKVVCSPSVLSDTEEKIVKATFDSATSSKTTKAPSRSFSHDSPGKEVSVDEQPTSRKHKREVMKDSPVEPMEVDEGHKRTVLPEKPRSKILFVRNLVRPFTLLQLKEVLKQTGTLIEEGFWIDKIKSKCFVTYETEEQAAKTREALHNTRWPASNPKILSVEYTTQEELDYHKNSSDQPKLSLTTPSHSLDRQDSNIPSSDTRRKEREEKDHPKERDRQKQTVIYIREWDKDKISQESPERERERRHASRSGEKSRSSEKKKDKKGKSENMKESSRDDKDTRKRPSEDTPAKLLDDLFQKTKATPCIYWLPLTEEQVKQKEEQRRLRRLEREKRNQEEEAERQARRKPRDKESRSRTRSPARRR